MNHEGLITVALHAMSGRRALINPAPVGDGSSRICTGVENALVAAEIDAFGGVCGGRRPVGGDHLDGEVGSSGTGVVHLALTMRPKVRFVCRWR